MTSTQHIRESLVEALPLTTSTHGEAPERRHLYLPPAHAKALRLECNLVIGARGVGKSFWTAALGSPALRAALGKAVRELETTEVHVGFGVAPDIDAFPDKEVFAQLIGKGFEPFEIWKGVVARWLSKLEPVVIPTSTWEHTIDWVRTNPEELARTIQNTNRALSQKNRHGLILFDALDRTSNDWGMMDRIVRDLLKIVLWLKSYPRLHAKVFLREDQSDRTITDFPDASKLLATKAELTWAPHDLHGLLWQTLCNCPGDEGVHLRDLYNSVVGTSLRSENQLWLIADEVKRESSMQRELFIALAGPWMGKDRRRGVPYIWSVSHLADGRGRTSPRSFLAAIRQAAEDSLESYPGYSQPLHYESIKRGVQKASQIRVSEVAEDYPWVESVMAPLHGLTVPCHFEVIEERWQSELPPGLLGLSGQRLPPQHAEKGWSGVRSDLERLGVFETMKDGRVNLPDLYRVGFGLGRRGGVKPVARMG
ncbi:hypothetical protein RRX38_13775 [Pseudomonas sp. DTU_2021_1001937_2_SI_NGA_ILE_001]|uniref:hypothetical protein n=1 Tax=Pseudomonas sp. DTU_2021_1001937_2_SI_NGA_ILE_001 TaxID=3077589 RepID=UPI0028FC1B33|nr:hypothetical protein [Pseudomonas sp. DTU_2021_1001937_2_SI_NGA_ILE_001]WNW12165.1 hypothetical protein RRX38_13775 [Pseudomonas sp. DTU_2021_1001937_2_SI_NGA_ILE_001]